jgi:hypothetical protein
LESREYSTAVFGCQRSVKLTHLRSK